MKMWSINSQIILAPLFQERDRFMALVDMQQGEYFWCKRKDFDEVAKHSL